MVYKYKDNDWYSRSIPLEECLVLSYEIWPSQVLIAVRFGKFWIVVFRDKLSNRIKFLRVISQ